MATLNELTYSVRESLNIHSDDSDISDEWIQFVLNNNRNKLIKQRVSNVKTPLNAKFKQLLNSPLEASKSVVGDAIVKSIDPIPRTVDINGINNRSTIFSPDITNKTFTLVPFTTLMYTGIRAHLKDVIYCAYDPDNYLHLKSGNKKFKFVRSVNIWDVFESPEDVEDLDDIEYPILDSMLPDLLSMSINDVAVKFNIPTDKQNNADDLDVGTTKNS